VRLGVREHGRDKSRGGEGQRRAGWSGGGYGMREIEGRPGGKEWE